MNQESLGQSLVRVLSNAPAHFVTYVVGLVVAILDDYTLMTLTIFAVLLGFLTSVLVAVAAFFGAYFVMRLVSNIAEAIGFLAVSRRNS